MAGFENDIMYAKNADFTQADNQNVQESNGLVLDGQLWIGRTSLSPGGTHIGVNRLTGGTGISITNGPGTITIANTGSLTDLHTAKFIVGDTSNGANYTTIASAITAASSGDTVFIQNGTYTENLTLKPGVNLVAFASNGLTGQVIINGNATLTAAGTVAMYGVLLRTNGAACLTSSGANACTLALENCYIDCVDATGVSFSNSNASSSISFIDSYGNIGTTGISFFDSTSPGAVAFTRGSYANSGGSTTASTISAGAIGIDGTTLGFSISMTGTSAAQIINPNWTPGNQVALTKSSSGDVTLFGGFFNTVASTCIVIDAGGTFYASGLELLTLAADAISGTGQLRYTNLTVFNENKLSAAVQAPLTASNDAFPVSTPGAYPYTIVSQDNLIRTSTSSANTVLLPATPYPGQRHIVKDYFLSAGTNPITVDGNGKNITSNVTAATYTINTNGGSATFIYDGFVWEVVSSYAGAVDLHNSRYIVGDVTKGANYSTIQAAITAAIATAPDTVFIQPGVYSEDLTLHSGVNLSALGCDPYGKQAASPSVRIIGDATFSTTGVCSCSGIMFVGVTSAFTVSGSSATGLFLFNCFLYVLAGKAITFSNSQANSFIKLINCMGDIDSSGVNYFAHTGTGTLSIFGGQYENTLGSTTASTVSSGTLNIYGATNSYAITASGTATGKISNTAFYTTNYTSFTNGSSNSFELDDCNLQSGTATALVVNGPVTLTNPTIKSTNAAAISGSNTLKTSPIAYTDTGRTNSVTTQIGLTPGVINQVNEVTGTSASAGVNLGYIANNAGLVTITLPATYAVGDIVSVTGSGAGGWILTAQAGDTIQFGGTPTSSGGSLASIGRYNSVLVQAITANTTWNVIGGSPSLTVT